VGWNCIGIKLFGFITTDEKEEPFSAMILMVQWRSPKRKKTE
jgi:hypothetical protein